MQERRSRIRRVNIAPLPHRGRVSHPPRNQQQNTPPAQESRVRREPVHEVEQPHNAIKPVIETDGPKQREQEDLSKTQMVLDYLSKRELEGGCDVFANSIPRGEMLSTEPDEGLLIGVEMRRRRITRMFELTARGSDVYGWVERISGDGTGICSLVDENGKVLERDEMLEAQNINDRTVFRLSEAVK